MLSRVYWVILQWGRWMMIDGGGRGDEWMAAARQRCQLPQADVVIGGQGGERSVSCAQSKSSKEIQTVDSVMIEGSSVEVLGRERTQLKGSRVFRSFRSLVWWAKPVLGNCGRRERHCSLLIVLLTPEL